MTRHLNSLPDVSIVIIVHNDPVNLVFSVESATSQTLKNVEILIVDDCSDDDSYQVVLDLAAKDDRIRVLQTAHNSGGPGAPRNRGFEESRAPWVTFVDSDDVLEQSAIEVMLRAAEEDRADIVCGQTRRLHLVDGRWAGWRARAYRERRHLSSIDEHLDLATDTMAPAKLYRKAFLYEHEIIFHEGVHYEELIFTAAAYKHASSISVVPDYVYIWKVYPTDVRHSITQQRHDERSLEYRLEAWERVEELVSSPGDERLRSRLRLKFLQHDARLYLSDFPALPAEQALRVIHRLEPRLRLADMDLYSKLSLKHRLMYGMALSGCVEGVLEVVQWPTGGMMPGRTVADRGRVVWMPAEAECCIPESDSLEYRLLDITGDPVLRTPFPLIRYAHVATAIAAGPDGSAIVSGSTYDPFRKLITRINGATAVATFSLLEEEASFSCPVKMRLASDERVDWEFSVKVPPNLPFRRPMRFDLALEIDNGDAANSSPVLFALTSKPTTPVGASGSVRKWLRQRFVFYEARAGRMRLKLAILRGKRARLEPLFLSLAEKGRLLPGAGRPVRHARPTDSVRALDLPSGVRVLLYAPASAHFASDLSGMPKHALDVRRWEHELGAEYYMLVRLPEGVEAKIPRRLAGCCVDVSDYDDVGELYRASDGLITDYSPAILDYISLDRPIFIYVPDDVRSAMYDDRLRAEIEQSPPGRISRSQDELHAQLRAEWDDQESKRLRAEFMRLHSDSA